MFDDRQRREHQHDGASLRIDDDGDADRAGGERSAGSQEAGMVQPRQGLSADGEQKPRFHARLSYPKLVGAGFTGPFLVQIFPPRQHHAAAARARNIFGDASPEQVPADIRLRPGTIVQISLSSPAMRFSGPVRKPIPAAGCDTSFTGKPSAAALPGAHSALLTISDESGSNELLSVPFQIRIVDYAFDHVSRPMIGRVAAGLAGVASAAVLILALITKTDLVLKAGAGAMGLAMSAFVFTSISNRYGRPAQTAEGATSDPQAP